MAQKRIPIEIDLSTREAQRSVSTLNKELGKTEDGLDDTATAGQRMARALEMSADDMITELEGTRRAVDALERALGPDFDADVTDVVADLKRVGLATDDIVADADELAAALRRAGDVKIRAQELGFDDVDKALGRTTDSSRVTSTAIGGIGNSISELPGVGSLGPVAESMGMLAENALEGEANLKGLVVAGGGLAAVGLGVQLVQSHFEKLAAIKAWETEQIEDWADAIYEAEDAVEALAESYAQTGRVEVRTLTNGVQDVTRELARSNITIDEWTTAVQGGSAETEAISLKLKAAGLSAGQMENVITGLIFAQDQLKTANSVSADRLTVFGQSADAASAEVAQLDQNLSAINGRQATASISVDTLQANRALDELVNKLRAIGSRATVASVTAANRFRQYAKGTDNHPGGMAIVGEEGPELVDLPAGSKVHTNAASRAMLSGGGVTYNNHITINAGMGADSRSIQRHVVQALNEHSGNGGAKLDPRVIGR